MTADTNQTYRDMAARGKYRRLYTHLCSLQTPEWRVTFREMESILGFQLPASARLYRPWWGNQRIGGGHSQALAWNVAGWETAEVDMDAETLVLRCKRPPTVRTFDVDQVLPVHRAGAWPQGLSLRREDIYHDRL